MTGLLGPSGCGKSTLLRAVVGVQIVAGGTVEVLGTEAGSKPLRSRVLLMVGVTVAALGLGALTLRRRTG